MELDFLSFSGSYSYFMSGVARNKNDNLVCMLRYTLATYSEGLFWRAVNVSKGSLCSDTSFF